uniref:Ig-like domain-containing protein n=1 Tax=Ascaris lumbricoides TaxID=6252 RepID=A0A9J2PHD3_ASCLU
MTHLVLLFFSMALIIETGGAKHDEQRLNVIASSQEAAVVRIGMLINSINDVNFKQSTFKAMLTLTIVLEKSKRPVGGAIVRYDQYQYPFADLVILSKYATPLDGYRLITTANDGTSTTQRSFVHSNSNIILLTPTTAKLLYSQVCLQHVSARHPIRQLSLSWIDSKGARLGANVSPPNVQISTLTSELCEFDSTYALTEFNAATARHPIRQLSLSWIDSKGARLGANVSPPNVQISTLTSELCEFDSTYALTEFNAATARFGCVRAKLLMSRPLYIPLICFFLPSGLAVLVSWLVAYVDRNRIQTRLTLLIFSSFIVFFILLFIHILMNLSRKHLMLANKDSYIRAESRYRREKHALREACSGSARPPPANGRVFEKKHVEVVKCVIITQKQHFESSPITSSTSNSEAIVHDYFRRWSDYYSVMAARLDLGARIILPITFIIVALLYFLFYIIL